MSIQELNQTFDALLSGIFPDFKPYETNENVKIFYYGNHKIKDIVALRLNKNSLEIGIQHINQINLEEFETIVNIKPSAGKLNNWVSYEIEESQITNQLVALLKIYILKYVTVEAVRRLA